METRGTRLRAYLFRKTGGAHGWVNALAEQAGVRRQSLSAWMGDRTSPDLESLAAVAAALDVRTSELVAAMEGEAPVADPEAAIRRVVEAVLDEHPELLKGRRV